MTSSSIKSFLMFWLSKGMASLFTKSVASTWGDAVAPNVGQRDLLFKTIMANNILAPRLQCLEKCCHCIKLMKKYVYSNSRQLYNNSFFDIQCS